MASVRTQWTDFDKDTRKYIKKRDEEKCVVCGSKGALQIMHIFVNRSHGGKGSKENGCLGCIKCHSIIDNYIGNEQRALADKYLNKCKEYLIEKEHIIYSKEFLDGLKFDKISYLKQKQAEYEVKQQSEVNYATKCKHCNMLVKDRFNRNNTIPSYYCKFKKMLMNKNMDACSNFRRLK